MSSEALSWLARFWWLIPAAVPIGLGVYAIWRLRRRWLGPGGGRPIHRTEEQLDRESERLENHREEQREAADAGRTADHADVDDHWMRGDR